MPVTPQRPLTVRAAAGTAPASLVDRRHVAAALDRGGPSGRPDGVISQDELKAAGIHRVEAAARSAINAPGEQGEAITVDELAKALSADQVVITSAGALTIENRRGRFEDGAIAPSSPWSFPEVQDLVALERYEAIIPRLSRYHPSHPDGRYVDRVRDGYDQVKVGTRKVKVGTDRDGNPIYREEPIYEERARYKNEIQYDRLHRDLSRKAAEVLEATREAQDPAIVQAREAVDAALESGGFFASRESRTRKLYRALEALERIKVPARPAVHAEKLDQAIERTAAAIDEQDRIAAAVPVEEAKKAVAAEVERLKGATTSNFALGGLGTAVGGALGFFALGAGALAGLPLIAAAAGIGLAAGGLGWLAATWIKRGSARSLERDLAVLQNIDPLENRKEMEQHALGAYRLLQDARGADTLGAVRQFETAATAMAGGLQTVEARAADQTRSLKSMEGWVLKARG